VCAGLSAGFSARPCPTEPRPSRAGEALKLWRVLRPRPGLDLDQGDVDLAVALAQRGQGALAQAVGQVVVDGEYALLLPEAANVGQARSRRSRRIASAIRMTERS